MTCIQTNLDIQIPVNMIDMSIPVSDGCVLYPGGVYCFTAHLIKKNETAVAYCKVSRIKFRRSVGDKTQKITLADV